MPRSTAVPDSPTGDCDPKQRPLGRPLQNALSKAAPASDAAATLSMFTGTYTAIVTPFRNGQLDEPALERLVKAQVKGGVDGIIPVGTTGESPTLDYDEHIRVVELAVKAAAGKIQVLAGTGSNSTREAIELTQRAAAVGAVGSLQVAPYYNKPTPEGMYQHFKAIAAATKLPLMLYSVPGRCGVEIAVDTVVRLAKDCPTIVSIKEAGGSCDRVSQLRAALPAKFTILSGDDSLTLPFMSVGAAGVVSVASNVAPKQVSAMVNAFAEGDLAKAQKLHAQFYPLFKNLFVESNPAPVKAALALLGGIAEELRLPLVPVTSKSRELIADTLKQVGLLK